MSSESRLLGRGKKIMRAFVEEYLQDDAEYFDIAWNAMDSRGLLGSFHPVQGAEPENRIGVLSPGIELVVLPLVIGVLSGILVEVIIHGLPVRKAMSRNRQEAQRIFREIGNLPDDYLKLLDQFASFLEDYLRKTNTGDEDSEDAEVFDGKSDSDSED